jgi:hypothetical protein
VKSKSPVEQKPRTPSALSPCSNQRAVSESAIANQWSVALSHAAETDELGEPPVLDLIFENAANRSPIQRVLIPIDAVSIKKVVVAVDPTKHSEETVHYAGFANQPTILQSA